MQLYFENWQDKFLDEICKTEKLRIISPFVKEQIIIKVQDKFDLKDVELITRYNLRDFASGVSSLNALKLAVEQNAKVYGIQNLHSKIYIFDHRAAIVTSANLTTGGMTANYECGIYITDDNVIEELHAYFDRLKRLSEQPLSVEQCDLWANMLNEINLPNTPVSGLPDLGASVHTPAKNRRYFVKFFGTGADRVDFNTTVREEVERALCHYACGFSSRKKPREFSDGDIVYMARMTYAPPDYAIFGKAEAITFVDGRDIATKAEKAERKWKDKWPIYLRLKNSVFIDGTMADCSLFYDLIKTFDYNSFVSTRRRYDNGKININPKRSLSQRAYIELTDEAAKWLEPRFQANLLQTGQVPADFIAQLPMSEIIIPA